MLPDWHTLAAMRRRGERPLGGVWITPDSRRREQLMSRSLFAVGLPDLEQVYLAAGLDVFLLAQRDRETVDIAQAIAAANPRYFATAWEGDKWREVVTCRAS